MAGLATAMSACVQSGPQDFITDQDGPEAEALDRLWDPVFAIATVIFFGVMLGILFIIWKFKASSDDDAPKQIHGNAKLELGWTILPAVLLLFVGIGTVLGQLRLSRAPENALEVNVTGHQFWWEYEYPEFDNIRTANELHIPVGRPVRLNLRSEEGALGKKGVIHSFWIPKLAGKQDVVPGRVNHLNIEASRPGTFSGQCVEFCGSSHANMRAKAVAHSPEDFEKWVAGQQRASTPPTGGLAAEGAEVFANACIGCHSVRGLTDEDGEEIATGRVGPDLTHLQSRKVFAGAIFDLNEKNLRKWLRDPPAEKPMNVEGGTGMPNLGLTEEQITSLIAYLETLE